MSPHTMTPPSGHVNEPLISAGSAAPSTGGVHDAPETPAVSLRTAGETSSHGTAPTRASTPSPGSGPTTATAGPFTGRDVDPLTSRPVPPLVADALRELAADRADNKTGSTFQSILAELVASESESRS